MHNTRGQERATADSGFTLVELLIVIVILGVLSTVTVFAVQGIADRGETAASDADEQVLARAQEAHMASEGAYASEADLVAAGLLREESSNLDITVANDLMSYEIVAAGGGGGGGGGGQPWTPGTTAPATFGGFDVLQYGNGATTVLLVGRPDPMPGAFADYVANVAPSAELTLYQLVDPTVDTLSEMTALFDQADYVVVSGFDLVGGTDAGSLAFAHLGQPATAEPASRWYAWYMASGGYLADIVPLIEARLP